MPAHMRDMRITCAREGCSKLACVEVMTTRNESVGKFCARCGKARVDELNNPAPSVMPHPPAWVERERGPR